MDEKHRVLSERWPAEYRNLYNKIKLGKTRKIRGIYFLFKNDSLLYIGKSINIVRRLGHHIQKNKIKFTDYGYIEIEKNISLDVVEQRFIHDFKPTQNAQLYKTSIPPLKKLKSKNDSFIMRGSKIIYNY